jgi:prepilin-type N-terminal cleavage/methylation domain-containing protein/prepilin-type processing-associated H-X9-DG protein
MKKIKSLGRFAFLFLVIGAMGCQKKIENSIDLANFIAPRYGAKCGYGFIQLEIQNPHLAQICAFKQDDEFQQGFSNYLREENIGLSLGDWHAVPKIEAINHLRNRIQNVDFGFDRYSAANEEYAFSLALREKIIKPDPQFISRSSSTLGEVNENPGTRLNHILTGLYGRRSVDSVSNKLVAESTLLKPLHGERPDGVFSFNNSSNRTQIFVTRDVEFGSLVIGYETYDQNGHFVSGAVNRYGLGSDQTAPNYQLYYGVGENGPQLRRCKIFFDWEPDSFLEKKYCYLETFGFPPPLDLKRAGSKKLSLGLLMILIIGTTSSAALFIVRRANRTKLSNQRQKAGFTLVELLVVIGIIGTLIALLLPAVQMVRESGRRTVCSNNIRQLALGLMNYESAHGQLPMGLRSFQTVPGSGSSSAVNQYYGMSWITRILPFIEQNAMWENAIEDYRYSPIPFRRHRGMQTVLPPVACPSDPVSGEVHWTHEGRLVACTNYLGVHGTNYKTRDGVFTYDEPIRLPQIGDGQSNTLLIGERPPSPDFWYGWWYATGSGTVSTGDVTLGVAELNPAKTGGISTYLEGCPAGPYAYSAGRNEQCDTLHFWSYHSGGANFALADGSVRLIPYSISAETLGALATRAGGEAVTLDF